MGTGGMHHHSQVFFSWQPVPSGKVPKTVRKVLLSRISRQKRNDTESQVSLTINVTNYSLMDIYLVVAFCVPIHIGIGLYTMPGDLNTLILYGHRSDGPKKMIFTLILCI
jgi:hypothetical protein